EVHREGQVLDVIAVLEVLVDRTATVLLDELVTGLVVHRDLNADQGVGGVTVGRTRKGLAGRVQLRDAEHTRLEAPVTGATYHLCSPPSRCGILVRTLHVLPGLVADTLPRSTFWRNHPRNFLLEILRNQGFVLLRVRVHRDCAVAARIP